MTPYDRLKLLCSKHGLSINELEEKVGLGQNTLYSWKKNIPSGQNLTKVADYFHVSTDYLLGRTDTKYYELSEKEKLDIGKEVDNLLEGMFSSAEVNFYGEPMTEEGKESLRMAIQMAMELNKEKAKKNFTPKKYRK